MSSFRAGSPVLLEVGGSVALTFRDDAWEDPVTSSDHSGDRRRAGSQVEDPTTAVPEADAAEQRIPASDDGNDSWAEEASGEVFEQASEADVIEQSRDAGPDDDEHR